MARTLKPRYVKLNTVGLVGTENGLALEAKDDDGRTVYVVVTPLQVEALALQLPGYLRHSWFQEKLAAAREVWRNSLRAG